MFVSDVCLVFEMETPFTPFFFSFRHTQHSINIFFLFPLPRTGTVASLLKMYFRELKEPLFPFHCYDDLIKCGPDVKALKALVCDRYKVPQENYDILASLMYFLKDISKHSDVNKMTPNALSICWSQSLMRTPTTDMDSSDPTAILMAFAKDAGVCNTIVETLIEDVNEIFEERLLYSML